MSKITKLLYAGLRKFLLSPALIMFSTCYSAIAIIARNPNLYTVITQIFCLLCLLACFYISILPKHPNVTNMGVKKERLSTPAWIGSFILIYIALALFLLSSSYILFGFAQKTNAQSHPLDFSYIISYFNTLNKATYYLLPIAPACFYAFGVLIVAKVKKGAATFNDFVANCDSKKYYYKSRDTIKFATSCASLSIIVLCLVNVFVLLLAFIDTTYFGYLIDSYILLMPLGFFVVLLSSNPSRMRGGINKLNKLGVDLNIYFILIILGFILGFITLAYLFNNFTGVKFAYYKSIVLYLAIKFIDINWALFLCYMGLLLASVPLVGSIIARVSRGRSLEHLFVLSFSIPFILNFVDILPSLISYLNIELVFNTYSYLHCKLNFILSLAFYWLELTSSDILLPTLVFNLFLLFCMGYKVYGNSVLISGFYPKEGNVRYHGIIKFVPALITVTALMLFFSIKAGWVIFGFYLSLSGVLIIWALLAGLFAIVKQNSKLIPGPYAAGMSKPKLGTKKRRVKRDYKTD